MTVGLSLADGAQLGIALVAVLAALLIPATAYWRRPKLELTEETAGRHSRVEADGVAYLRLFVRNKRRRRAALATRVLVEGYRPLDDNEGWVSLSHPVLGWPSAVDAEAASVTLYSGSGRPIGLGHFMRTGTVNGRLARSLDGQHVLNVRVGREERAVVGHTLEDVQWSMLLSLHNLDILDDRDKLPAGDWVIRLLVGANDGDAKRYDVHIGWDRDAPSAAAILAEALDHLHVDPLR